MLTNPTLMKLYYDKLEESLSSAGFQIFPPLVIADGEKLKSLESLGYCYDQLVKHRADRSSLLLTLGGGVITDLGGVVAATYMRGISLAHLPTSLLAQVDAAIGGKAAVNHTRAKNVIGCFYQSRLVLVDPLVLGTLSQRHYLNGLAEVIKIGLVSNPKLFRSIEKNIDALVERRKAELHRLIMLAIRQKIKITARDPYEQGVRKILNLGHTFAHALEAYGKYDSLLHGEAVALGMLVALKLSFDLKIGSAEILQSVQALLKQAGLPTRIKRLDLKEIWEIMYLDKKAGYGKINFVLLEGVGQPKLKSVNFDDFKQAVEIIC